MTRGPRSAFAGRPSESENASTSRGGEIDGVGTDHHIVVFFCVSFFAAGKWKGKSTKLVAQEAFQ